MTGDLRPARRGPEPYVHGLTGACVVLTGRVADWLIRTAHLDDLRIQVRGQDSEIDDQMLAMRLAAMHWRSGIGTSHVPLAESAREWITAPQAADMLGLSVRGVTAACQRGRLIAERVGGRWRIDPQSVDRYGKG